MENIEEREIEKKVKDFCRIMNIKIINDKVEDKYKREVEDYIHSLVKPKPKESFVKIADLLKKGG